MKKKVLSALLIGLTAGSGICGWHYSHTRHPRAICNDQGCEFVYDLCVPMPPPQACEPRTFNLAETYGDKTNFMPWDKRSRSYTSQSDLRFEAEQRADEIENVKLVHETDAPP